MDRVSNSSISSTPNALAEGRRYASVHKLHKFSDISSDRSQIGINYTGQSLELGGCHNDALNIMRFLIRQSASIARTPFPDQASLTDQFGYRQDDIVVLMDKPENSLPQQPTKDNIVGFSSYPVCDTCRHEKRRGEQCNGW
jgi:hypothetical protein